MFNVLKPIYIRRLKPVDAAKLFSLEKTLFETEQRNGFEAIEEILSESEEFEGNLCCGLFKYRRVLGYFLSYPYGSVKDPNSEDEAIIFVSDVAVLPKYRKYGYELVTTAIKDMARYYPERPVEHYSTLRYRRLWEMHQHTARNLGYRLVRSERCQNASFSKDLYWLRWESDPTNLKGDR